MGLLDALIGGGNSGGGLLDFLRSNALNQQMGSGQQSDQAQYSPMSAMAQMQPVFQPTMPQQNAQPSPLDNAQWPAGPVGAPSQANAQMPPPQPPPVIGAQPQAPQLSGPGFGDRLLATMQSVGHPGGLLQSVANGVTAFSTGQPAGPQADAKQAQNLTLRALIQKGVDPQTAQAAIGNPELLKTLITQTYGPQTVQTLGNGYVWDARQNKAIRAYEPEVKKTFTSYKDANGNEVPGTFDPDSGKFEPMNQGGAATVPNSNLTGQPYLDTLDPGRAATVKAMVEGRLAPPTGAALRSDKVAKLLNDAAQYEPGFDASKWTRRNATSRDFASGGKSGQNVTSLNTVYGHIADLAEKGAALDNVDGWPIINSYINDAKNAYSSGSGQAKVNDFNLARNAVADELSKVFKGAGISDHEIEQWKGTINTSQSPTQLKGAVKTAFGLIESRLHALNNARDAGMDTNTDFRELLNAESKAKQAKVQKWIDGDGPKPAEATTTTAPNRAEVEAEMRKRGLLK